MCLNSILKKTLYPFPEIQDKLQAEIDNMFEDIEDEGAFPDYYAVQGLEYLDKVILFYWKELLYFLSFMKKKRNIISK